MKSIWAHSIRQGQNHICQWKAQCSLVAFKFNLNNSSTDKRMSLYIVRFDMGQINFTAFVLVKWPARPDAAGHKRSKQFSRSLVGYRLAQNLIFVFFFTDKILHQIFLQVKFTNCSPKCSNLSPKCIFYIEMYNLSIQSKICPHCWFFSTDTTNITYI